MLYDKSVSELVWDAVNKTPMTASQTIQKTGIKKTNVSSALSMMEKRGMVCSRQIVNPSSVTGFSKEYYTVAASYVLSKPARKTSKKSSTKSFSASVSKDKSFKSKFDIDSLTLREAQELFMKLKKMFV